MIRLEKTINSDWKYNMKRIVLTMVVCAMILVVGTVQAETLQGRIHSQMPAVHYVAKGVDLFITEVTEKTGGAIKFTHFPSQQLYRDKDIPDVLPKGGVEAAQINSAMFVGKVAEAGIIMLPATFNDVNHFYRYLYDYKNSGAGAFLDNAFRKKTNMVNLGTLLYSPNTAALTNKPVTDPSSYKGMKIRGPGKIFAVNLQAWGASGVVMSSSDVYMALERGTIDGAFSGVSSFYSRKWYEAAKYMSVVDGLMPLTFNLCVNLDFWNKLSSDQKKVLIEAAHKAELFCIDAAVQAWSEAEANLKSAGVEIYRFNKAQSQKLREMAQPPIFKIIIEKPLGKEIVTKVQQWVTDTSKGNMTAQQACQMNKERLLSEL